MPANPNPAPPPPLWLFKGEMVLASIAYRSKTLKRGLSAVDFKEKLGITVTVH
jgi:hypothetical protein